VSQERTEKPTPHRLKEGRKKGQIPRSRDLALAIASAASTMALAWLGPKLVAGLLDGMRSSLATIGDQPMRTVTAGELNALVAHHILQLAILVGPIALVTMVAAVGMHGFQGGWSFSPDALDLHWSRLNPASGLTRFSFANSGVESLKAVLVFSIVGYYTWHAMIEIIDVAPAMAFMSPINSAIATWTHVEGLLWRTAWVLTALALADFAWQRYRVMSSLKMTRQEVRDEHKQMEGSGEVKGRMRRLQREFTRRRMLRDVPRATVVITNPSHFAVALEYRRDSMTAPRVLAKGVDHLARRIRERAIAAGVPIVENKPLARSLYASTEVGDVIPAPLFAAVAEVLAYLVRVKQLML
jgi:flagellar biosynthetic protein FlhB